MFGRSKTQEPAQVIVPPQPVGQVQNVVGLGEYYRLAAEINYSSPFLTATRLREFMAEQCLPVIQAEKVLAYMNALAKSEGKEWFWYPLRQEDQVGGQCGGISGSLLTGGRVYSRAVPVHVVRLVGRIPADLRDELGFYVTDFEVPNPDPFLMATPRMEPRNRALWTVLAVWDEPGFGEFPG